MRDFPAAAFAFVAWTSITIAFAGCSPAGTPAKESKSPEEATKVTKESPPAQPHSGLTDPNLASEKAPDKFKAKFTTTKGDFIIEVTRDWSPLGADRFYNLVKIGYFNDVAFFRVVEGFMAQFGIHGDPKVSARWRNANLQDDPVKESNKRGYISFAMAGPNTRSTQFFINFGDNSRLDKMGFSPFGKVVQGMEVVDSLFKGYGETPSGKQMEIQMQGNVFLKASYPNLDYIKSVTIVP